MDRALSIFLIKQALDSYSAGSSTGSSEMWGDRCLRTAVPHVLGKSQSYNSKEKVEPTCSVLLIESYPFLLRRVIILAASFKLMPTYSERIDLSDRWSLGWKGITFS